MCIRDSRYRQRAQRSPGHRPGPADQQGGLGLSLIHISPDDGGVYRLTPRQMETMYIQAPELALVHMGSVFLLDSLG